MLKRLHEQRSSTFHVSQEPPGWVTKGYGHDTISGEMVTPENALGVTAVLACVTVLAEDISTLPFILYKRLQHGKERAVNHSLYSILHDSPNPEMTAQTFWEITVGHVCGWGNAFSQIIMNNRGEVAQLWPLRPDRMQVVRKDGLKLYLYTQADGAPLTFTESEILHIPGFGYDGLVGFSRITLARNAIGMALATEKFGSKFFANDARPGVVLEHPKSLSSTASKNLRESWEDMYMGVENSHRVAVAEEGMTVKEIGIPPEDAQFLETRQFQISEICRIFRMPPHKIAHLINATFSNIEEQEIGYVTDTLRPWNVRLEQRVNFRLLTAQERTQYSAEFLLDALLRGDTTARFTAYGQARQWGWMSANEVREKENLNPIDGGDIYLVPMNMIPADQVGNLGSGPEPNISSSPNRNGNNRQLPGLTVSTETRELIIEKRSNRSALYRRRLGLAQQKVFKATAARVMRREKQDVLAAANKIMGNRDYGSFSLWLDDFYVEHKNFIVKNFAPVMQAYAESVAAAAGDEVNFEDYVDAVNRFVNAYIASFADRMTSISSGKIRKIIKDAIEAGTDPVTALEGLLEDWEEGRAQEIAQREVTREGNAVAKTVYILAGITLLRWVSFDPSCPYCSALNGKMVGKEEVFLSSGEFQPEGADKPLTNTSDVGHPPAHGGCDCQITAGE